jgi:hypothetical protein
MGNDTITLESFVEEDGSTRVRAFALDWEFQHARNSDRFPIFLTLTEWEQEFNAYMAEEAEYRSAS